ncbi:putative P-loop containing nucleoside triphosphate hydrolase, leucine-rich repeat domain, L [Medicago truncatula]|uniref:Putative P-loop containing nucleoside triphosphate hydrolase, leucine-rich repeat domain, L n=1 Tax=Medicago truncatula TaxID=3880 RepID=A0A396IQ31_MEDTR|nr:putative P-loop containing nucleoside triphosphate hydrolase, leucine-rich repeat domain, L [Medicago truncatula]
MTEVVKTLVEKLLNKGKEKSRYLLCFTRIVKEFNEEKEKLEAENATMKQRFKVATEKGKDIQFNAEFWQKQADGLIQENTETKQRCFLGFCPDCIWRYKRGEELATKTKVIKDLIEKADKFENIEITRGLPGVERYSSKDYISFESRKLKRKELLDALKDDSNYMVGLHGMGGSGKTTLAKEVGKQLKTLKHFNYVIDTTVSSNLNIKKIQDDIAGSLGLDLENKNESDRPKSLWNRLTNGDKILVILDDVWKNINFDEIGLPNSDNRKGCKVLVTTRELGVCEQMECGKTIQLQHLTEEDALIMFKMYAKLTNISDISILDKVREIVALCKGLPVAIVTIARSLKGKKHRAEWDLALNSLKNPMSMGNVEDHLVDIFKCLKFSYDNLKDEKAKGLFLLCSAFPEDEEISVELLTRLGIGVNLFGEGYDKYNVARNQVSAAKNKLLSSCLLLETEIGDVKMHDLVREVAQWIVKEKILAVNLFEKNQKSLVEKSKNSKILYFYGKLSELVSSKSHSSDGSKLEILIAKECEFQDVATSLHENMAGLRVLIFSNSNSTGHSSLANSIKLMINIRSLSVENVILGDISVLGSLQSLETLELHYCEIDEFSREIAKLKKLRLLCLKECEIKNNNPFEVIQSCPSLEELYFLKSFNKSCKEITLPRLERYVLSDFYRYWDASQLKVVALREDYLSKATYKYVIQTSYCLHLFRMEGYRNLMPEMVPIEQGMNDLIELHLEGSSQLQCLVDTKQFQKPIVFSKLAVLELERMEALEELCNGPISSDSMNFLKKLYINECKNLRSLFKCSLNLSKLKTVKLISCSRLVSVFKLSTSQSLPLLEELNIVDCEKLENIITFERREMDDTIEESANGYNDNKSCYSLFPKLKVLYIESCHQLQFILPILSAQDLLFLEVIEIRCCDKLEYIFGQHQDVKLTSLKTVDIHDLPNFIDLFPPIASSISKHDSKPQTQLDPIKSNTFSLCCFRYKARSTKIPIISEDQPQDYSMSLESNSYFLDILNSAQYLEEIKISNAPKMKSVLILSIPLRMLESLRIEKCDEMKQIIIDTGDHNSTSGNKFGNVFPKLKRLWVENCVQLEYIFGHYNHDHQNQTEMAKLELNECSQLDSGDLITTRSMDGTIVKELSGNEENRQQLNLSLEDIDLFDLPMMRCLFVGLKYSFVLNNLTEMKIVRCEKLEIVFSTSVLRCLPQLVRLEVEECKELKHIIEDDLEDKKFQSSNTFFPKLETLIVTKCDKLKYVFPVSICKEFPELKVMLIREANELEEIFKSDKKDEIEEISKTEVDIPNLKAVAFAYLPRLYHDQGVHFQTVKYRVVHICQKLSLTSCNEDEDKDDGDPFSIFEDYYLRSRFREIQRECDKAKGEHDGKSENDKETDSYYDNGNDEESENDEETDSDYDNGNDDELEGSTSEITAAATVSTITETDNKPPAREVVPKQKGIQINVEEGTASVNAKTIASSTHTDVIGSSSGQLVTSERKISSLELMNEQLMDQECLVNKQHRLGETDTTIKHSQEYNLEGSTSEITGAATVSTITETKNKLPTQEVVPKQKGIQINVEEGTASDNAKTITSSTHLDVAGSSSGQLDCKTSSQEDGDSQIAMTSFSISTAETNDQGSLNHDSFKKVSSIIEEQFHKDDNIIVSKSKPSSNITSHVVCQFPPVPSKEDPCQKVEDLSSLLVKSELEQLVSKNHLDWGNFYLLNNFFVKHPSVRFKDTSLSNRYKGCAYNLLAELLKFLKTHSVLEVLGSFHSEFEELLQDARRFGFDKDWLDGVERSTLCPDMQVSQDVLKKLLDSKEHVTKEVEVLRLKIGILSEQMEVLSEHVEVLKHQLASSQAVLESINQQEVALSAPVGY